MEVNFFQILLLKVKWPKKVSATYIILHQYLFNIRNTKIKLLID